MREAPSSDDGKDLIFVRGLNLKTITGVDHWQRPKPQPVTLSLWLRTSVALAGSTDHLPYSIHYGTVCKSVSALVEEGQFKSLEDLAEQVSALALGEKLNGEWVKVVVEQPRVLLRAEAAGISIVRTKPRRRGEIVPVEEDKVFIQDLRLVTIIGVNPWEREAKQNVVINLTLHKPPRSTLLDSTKSEFNSLYDFRRVVDKVSEYVEASDYKTVEAFVTAIAKVACVDCGVEKVTVRAEKPSALTFAKAPGVEITRHKSFFEQDKVDVDEEGRQAKGKHTAYIALGSNVGNRAQTIEKSLRMLDEAGIKVRKTSSLYETEPMYVEDQPRFLNGACQVETTLEPLPLLEELKRIEAAIGREKTLEKGPRSIDLDILLYDQIVLSSPTLTIPHAGMLEREFVLRPLCDLAPHLPHPLTSTSILTHLTTLPPSSRPDPVRPHAHFHPLPPLNPSDPKRRTLIMSILNLTPDSFSDGGLHSLDTIVETAKSHISQGASILDLGGLSTRPGSSEVPVDEEINRVVPAIKKLREAGIDAAISVDTYRSPVARAAVQAGANIINDVSAGTLDPLMLSTAAELNVPICLMHMRGTPATMNKLNVYDGDLITVIAEELYERVEAALRAGVRRWNIILDPGLGFAKNAEQNLEILRRLDELRNRREFEGLPWVLGPSRKRFVGENKEAKERVWGTAGAVSAAVRGGADVVRVHDVGEMGEVVRVGDAIWRV
ncbi:Dihydropteroate synthase [Ascobolus immersus RN42]|uniref:Folic acid synthesis protein FOL1 n=1 Tax=Ascobolus immersus RN42 TaxID=1160509 RepID=A0A3N4HQ33_ASCIM|nr:Dihydropteroate synthase [Ascobolus immersus RN42]